MSKSFSDAQTVERRAGVRQLAADPNIGDVVAGMVTPLDEVPLSTLKIGEYALLVHPLSRALEATLDAIEDTTVKEFARSCKKPTTLAETVGGLVFDHAWDALSTDPHFDLLQSIADARASRLGFSKFAQMDFKTNIKGASLSSATTMLGATYANSEIARQAGISRYARHADHVRVVRRSHALALNRPLVTLENNTNVGAAVDDIILCRGGAPSYNARMLEYDPAQQRVIMRRPFEDWVNTAAITRPGSGLSGLSDDQLPRIGDVTTQEAPLGCPVRFSPGLVIRYYEAVVDIVDAADVWLDA